MTSKRALLLSLAMATTVLGGVSPGEASCAPPTIEVQRWSARVGDPIKITGHAWMSGCDDTPDERGCSASEESAPIDGIELYLKGPKTDQTQDQINIGQIGETEIDIELGKVNANSEGEFRTTVVIPDVPPGVYFLTAEGDLPAYQPPEITITDR